MTRSDIKRNVLQKIDEISPYQQTDEQWDLLIESMLDDMANRFLLAIPVSLITKNTATLSARNKSHGINQWQDMALVTLPEDYLRFKYASCVHWRRIITEKDLYTTDSGEYNRQFDIHTRAGIAKPKAFIEPIITSTTSILTPQIEKNLIISPFRQNWYINSLIICYVKKVNAENLEDDILDGFYYFVANAVLTSMRQVEFANAIMGKFTEWLQLKSIKN